MNQDIVKTSARYVALGALFLVPLVPLIVVNGFFFPFITGKAFFFRVVVEIAFGAWVFLAIVDRAYRPRFSWILVAVLAFAAWMFLADALAVNAAKAFWSNFERMEGWVLLAHLGMFFVAASAVLRVEKKWRMWFLASLAVAVIVSLHGILQQFGVLAIHQGSSRIDSSFGNSAYFAIYLLWNTFIALWLAYTEKRAWLRWSLAAFAVVEAVLILFTETRGTVLGLLGALALSALLVALTAGKRARSYAITGLLALVLLAGGLYAARDTQFVKSSHVLERITSVSLADGSTRFTIWHLAFEGVAERPLTGWGQEGFNYVFDKFYTAKLYAQEPWFDRAHNAFIDWLVAGGVPALLLYLALFGSALWYLWTRSELSRPERIALTAALAGYACHNLFVFDNLYSYVYFFALLALVDSQVGRPLAWCEAQREADATAARTYVAPITAVATLALVWVVNVPGMQVASSLITAITPAADPATQLAVFQDLTAHPSFAAQEIREQLVSFEAQVIGSSAPEAVKQQAATLAITQMQKQVAAYPLDAREQLQLAIAYRYAGDYADAYATLEHTAMLMPQKPDIWMQLGVTAWQMGSTTAARAAFAKAYALAPGLGDAAAYAAAGDFMDHDPAAGDALLLQAYGTTTVDQDVLSVAYYQTKDWPRLIALWKLRVSAPGADAQTYFGLAAVYYAAGERQAALAELDATAATFPDTKDAVASAKQQIATGAFQ